MSALVRHRVSLFGKMFVSQHQSFWIFSIFSVFLMCVFFHHSDESKWRDNMWWSECFVNSISVFACAGTDASAIVNCLHILARSLDARFSIFVFPHKIHKAIWIKVFLFFIIFFVICLIRTVMKSGPEIVKAGLRSFFESAADDIEKMVENLKLGKVSKGNQVIEEQNVWNGLAHIPTPNFCKLFSNHYTLKVG